MDKHGAASVKAMYTWGKHDHFEFTLCGVHHVQSADWSITMDQREYVESLALPGFTD